MEKRSKLRQLQEKINAISPQTTESELEGVEDLMESCPFFETSIAMPEGNTVQVRVRINTPRNYFQREEDLNTKGHTYTSISDDDTNSKVAERMLAVFKPPKGDSYVFLTLASIDYDGYMSQFKIIRNINAQEYRIIHSYHGSLPQERVWDVFRHEVRSLTCET